MVLAETASNLNEFLAILWSVLGTAVTALVSWGVSLLIKWMNSKIKDKEVANWSTSITKIITDAVQSVFQSFVETMKKEGTFTEAAQKEAKEKALAIINSQLTNELKTYIQTNYGDIQKWLGNQIEAIIYKLKNKSSNTTDTTKKTVVESGEVVK